MLMSADTHKGDRLLLKQKRVDSLTPAYDPRPHAVVGVKGSMTTAKRGKEIKSRNYSHCKVLKYAGKDEYDVLDWDRTTTNEPTTIKPPY